MLNLLTLFRQNQIKQSYSASLTYQNSLLVTYATCTNTQHFIAFKICITAQKMKFSIKDFFSKCDQIGRKLRIWRRLLKKPVLENFIFYAVYIYIYIHSVICTHTIFTYYLAASRPTDHHVRFELTRFGFKFIALTH